MNETKTDPQSEMQLNLDFTFHAPIDLVFETLILPEHIKEWYCPSHLNLTFAESTPEIGGEYKIGVVAPGTDNEMMFLGKYLEMRKPDHLVYTQAFSMGPNGPVTPETIITIKLSQQGDTTHMSFNQAGFANKQSFDGARMSWPPVYDKLGNYLESLVN